MNKEIELLNNKLDAQDKIINTQALEIARLNEKINIYENPDDMTLMFMWCDEKAKDKIKELQARIDKAIEYIKSKHAIIDTDYIRIFDLFANRVEQGYINELLEILGDKENE